MSNISSLSSGTAQAPIVRDAVAIRRAGDQTLGAESRTAQVVTRGADSVDISELARRLAQRPTSDTLRPELVDRVRNEIESGEYDTPEKLDIALDRLFGDLDIQA